MKHFLLIPLLFLLLPVPPGQSAETDPVLSFARSLAAEGDHYRAITEFKRFLHLHPDDPSIPAVRLAMAESYMAGERWEQAEEVLSDLLADSPDSAEARRALRMQADIARHRGDSSGARERYRRILDMTTDPEERRRLHYLLAWTYVDSGEYGAAREALASLADVASMEFSDELHRISELPLKSPSLAGGLSALLPGAGQLYADRPRDAALAFLLNAAFLWGAVEAFENGNEATGAILLFFEAGWYTGNIFNAVNSTHKYNRALRQRHLEPLREDYGPTADRKDGVGPLLGVAGRF